MGSDSQCRHLENEQQRIEKEYQRIEKEKRRQEALSNIKLNLNKEDGTLQIENAFGEPLYRGGLTLLWDQKGHTVLEWLKQQIDEINGDVDLLTKIHEDTPAPDSIPEYQIDDFCEAPPSAPIPPIYSPKPEFVPLKPLGFFAILFRKKKNEFEGKQRRLNEEHKKRVLMWEKEKEIATNNYSKSLKEFNDTREKWETRKRKFDEAERKNKEEFSKLLQTDPNVMDKTFQDALNSLSWHRETMVSYQIMDKG